MHRRLASSAIPAMVSLTLAASVAAQEQPEGAAGAPSGASTWYSPLVEASEPDSGTPALVSFEVLGSAQVVSSDNADLLERDESSQQDILDTDDRSTTGRTWLTLGAASSPVEAVRLDVELGLGAAWGSSFADSDAGSVVGVTAASVDADAVATDAFRLSARAGRQRFEIGGAPADYFLSGMVDGFTAEAEFVDVLTVRALLFDFFVPQPFPEDRHSEFWDRPQGGIVNNQRGETNTVRTGAVVQTVDQLVDGLDARAFFFHASVGASTRDHGTGSDISEGGLLGNFRDRDYVQLMGVRAGYHHDVSDALRLGGFGEVARSSGVDRKEVTSIDVDLQGMAFGLGLDLHYDFGSGHVGLAGDWHRMDGAEYSVNGLEFNRGFVSMFGDEIGGLASASIAGIRPAATLGRYGVLHNPDDVDRNAGTDFTHVALDLAYRGTELNLAFWTYTDTRSSAFDQSTLDTVQPPPEHSREEFAAQRRAGLKLGNELDLTLRQIVHDHAAFFARGGVFLPGDYYAVEISRVATPEAIEGNYRLGGERTTFWAVAAGAEFGLGHRRER